MQKKTVALIPLRGNSKGIPNKNIRLIAGKPLCQWVLEAACMSSAIDQVYVSTDSRSIEQTVQSLNLPVQLIERPEEFATDTASTESVMTHFSSKISFDTLVTIQATSPLLTCADLDKAIDRFELNGLDSMVSAVRYKRFFWNDDGTPLNYNPRSRPRRQDFNGILMENGAFYVTKHWVLNELNCRLGGKTEVFEMQEYSAQEIDEPGDWTLVEKLLLQYSTDT